MLHVLYVYPVLNFYMYSKYSSLKAFLELQISGTRAISVTTSTPIVPRILKVPQVPKVLKVPQVPKVLKVPQLPKNTKSTSGTQEY